MSIITASYFFGDLLVAQLGQPSVATELQLYIDKYERKYLDKMFGYAFNKLLQQGIADSTQKYLDILNGVEYLDAKGAQRKWAGLKEDDDEIVVDSVGDLVLITERFYGNHINGATSIVDNFFTGKTVKTVFKEGFRFLVPTTEWTQTGNTINLLSGITLNNTEVVTVEVSQKYVSGVTVPILKKSPIANYIYFYWLRSRVSETTGTGEATITPQNAIRVSSHNKQRNAWNDMVEMNTSLVQFLLANETLYPEFKQYHKEKENFDLLHTINTLNL